MNDTETPTSEEFQVEDLLLEDDLTLNPYTSIQILSGHRSQVRIFLPIDESKCASAGDDKVALIWNVQSGEIIHTLEGHRERITCMQYREPTYGLFEKKKILLTGSTDNLLIIWDLKNAHKLKVVDVESSLQTFTTLENGRLTCGIGKHVTIWGQNFSFLCDHRLFRQSDIMHVASFHECILACATGKQILCYIFSREGWLPGIKYICKLLQHKTEVKNLVAVNDETLASASADNVVIVWSTKYWTPIYQIDQDAFKSPLKICTLASLGKKYLALHAESGFLVYSATENNLLLDFTNYEIKSLTLSHSNSVLVTCCMDGTLLMWGFPSFRCSKRDSDKENLKNLFKMKLRLISLETLCDALSERSNFTRSVRPRLIGKCSGISTPIENNIFVQSYDPVGLASFGTDNTIILWRDRHYQRSCHHKVIQELLSKSLT